MRGTRWPWLQVAGCILGLVLLTAGCSSATKRKWLTFFFDGVPSETAPPKQPIAQHANTNQHVVEAPRKAVLPVAPQHDTHRPFAEGKCIECHGDSGLTPQPRMPPPKLCFTCHKDFRVGLKVKHQPVDNGECLSCHAAHESPNSKLLLKKGTRKHKEDDTIQEQK